MKKWIEARNAGEEYEFEGKVIAPPERFIQWASENSDKIKDSQSREKNPYFVKENQSFIEDINNAKEWSENTGIGLEEAVRLISLTPKRDRRSFMQMKKDAYKSTETYNKMTLSHTELYTKELCYSKKNDFYFALST